MGIVTGVDTHYLYLFLIYFHVISSIQRKERKGNIKKKKVDLFSCALLFVLFLLLAIDSRLTLSLVASTS